jgi:hypothetical protein
MDGQSISQGEGDEESSGKHFFYSHGFVVESPSGKPGWLYQAESRAAVHCEALVDHPWVPFTPRLLACSRNSDEQGKKRQRRAHVSPQSTSVNLPIAVVVLSSSIRN